MRLWKTLNIPINRITLNCTRRLFIETRRKSERERTKKKIYTWKSREREVKREVDNELDKLPTVSAEPLNTRQLYIIPSMHACMHWYEMARMYAVFWVTAASNYIIWKGKKKLRLLLLLFSCQFSPSFFVSFLSTSSLFKVFLTFLSPPCFPSIHLLNRNAASCDTNTQTIAFIFHTYNTCLFPLLFRIPFSP